MSEHAEVVGKVLHVTPCGYSWIPGRAATTAGENGREDYWVNINRCVPIIQNKGTIKWIPKSGTDGLEPICFQRRRGNTI